MWYLHATVPDGSGGHRMEVFAIAGTWEPNAAAVQAAANAVAPRRKIPGPLAACEHERGEPCTHYWEPAHGAPTVQKSRASRR